MLEKILIESAKTIGAECLNTLNEKISDELKIDEKPEKKIEVKEKKVEKKPSEKVKIEPVQEIKNTENVPDIHLVNAYGRNKRLGVMVVCAVLGLLVCLLILTFAKQSGEVVGIVSTIAGIFGACLKDAYSFEFGSSRGSREKDERISATLRELKF